MQLSVPGVAEDFWKEISWKENNKGEIKKIFWLKEIFLFPFLLKFHSLHFTYQEI